ERDRRVSFRFPSSDAHAVASDEAPPEKRSSTLGIVLLGVGAVAAGTAVTFGGLGKSRQNDLDAQAWAANGTCSPSDVDVVRRDYWIAGIAGGVSVVAIGLGLWQVLSQSSRPASRATLTRDPFIGRTGSVGGVGRMPRSD